MWRGYRGIIDLEGYLLVSDIAEMTADIFDMT